VTENLKKKCDIILAAMLGEDNIEKWWQSRNKAFNMMTAQEQFDIDPEIVYNYLMLQALR
jgi:hypothetical protein